jgi:ribosomal protein L15
MGRGIKRVAEAQKSEHMEGGVGKGREKGRTSGRGRKRGQASLFVCLFFETGFLCVALAVLELTL